LTKSIWGKINNIDGIFFRHQIQQICSKAGVYSMIQQGAGRQKGWRAALKAGGSSVTPAMLEYLHPAAG